MNSTRPLLEIIIDRIAFSDAATGAYFFVDEINTWDAQQFEMLLEQGLIELSQQYRNQVTCTGCEERCVRSVEIIPKTEKQGARAFVVCNQRDDVGYIPVNFDELKQCHSSGDLFASVLLKHITTAPVPYKGLKNGSEWPLGLSGGVPLLLKSSPFTGLVIVINKESIDLKDFIGFRRKKLAVNLQLLQNALAKVSYQESSKDKGRRLLKRKKELISKGKRNYLQIIKREENINSETWLKEIIKRAEQEEEAEKQKTGKTLLNPNWMKTPLKNSK